MTEDSGMESGVWKLENRIVVSKIAATGTAQHKQEEDIG